MLKRNLLIRVISVAILSIVLLYFCFFITGFFDRMVISNDSGLYSEDIKVSARIMKSGTIYYTLDGTEPDTSSETTFCYEGPIELQAADKEKVTTICFKAYFANGETSKTYQRTYFVGKEVEKRYSTYVVSVITDPDNLYGYENGIFAEGKIRDEYMKEHPDEEIAPETPANYMMRGPESERKVYVEMFDDSGKEIISQFCGIRTGGDFSRGSEQKPFRLFAREDLYATDKFDYNFFSSKEEDTDMLSGGYTSFDTLYFRNSGNDRQEAYIRDELAQQLARNAGFLDTQYFAPAAVYINGEYAGFYWMHSQYNKSYFKQKYGKFSGDMVIVGDGEKHKSTETENELSNQYAPEYNEKYDYFSSQDLTDDNIYQELNQFIDVENYLQYFALEIYFGNIDWPRNNEKAYRYVNPKGNYTPNTVFDGRYRYLLYDIDTSLGRGCIRESIDAWVSVNKLEELLSDNTDAPLFRAIMQRRDAQEYFTKYMYYLMDEVCTPEKVSDIVDTLDSSRRQELNAYIEVLTGQKAEDFKYLDMQLDAIKAWSEVNADPMKYELLKLWAVVP